MMPTFLQIEKERTAELLIKFLKDANGEAGRLPYSIEEKEKSIIGHLATCSLAISLIVWTNWTMRHWP